MHYVHTVDILLELWLRCDCEGGDQGMERWRDGGLTPAAEETTANSLPPPRHQTHSAINAAEL